MVAYSGDSSIGREEVDIAGSDAEKLCAELITRAPSDKRYPRDVGERSADVGTELNIPNKANGARKALQLHRIAKSLVDHLHRPRPSRK